MPKISVIIPAKNEERYLGETIESVKAQTYEDLEIIVIDDCSTDSTPEIAVRHGAKLVNLTFKSVCRSRNFGAILACSNCLVFLDADTRLADISIIEKIRISYKQGVLIGTCLGEPQIKTFQNRTLQMIKNLGIRFLCASTPIIFCRRDIFLKIGGFDEKRYPKEPIHLFRKMLKYGKRRVLTEKVLTSFRRYEEQGYVNMLIFWSIFRFLRNSRQKKSAYENGIFRFYRQERSMSFLDLEKG